MMRFAFLIFAVMCIALVAFAPEGADARSQSQIASAFLVILAPAGLIAFASYYRVAYPALLALAVAVGIGLGSGLIPKPQMPVTESGLLALVSGILTFGSLCFLAFCEKKRYDSMRRRRGH